MFVDAIVAAIIEVLDRNEREITGIPRGDDQLVPALSGVDVFRRVRADDRLSLRDQNVMNAPEMSAATKLESIPEVRIPFGPLAASEPTGKEWVMLRGQRQQRACRSAHLLTERDDGLVVSGRGLRVEA